jgi:hypothetical protein
VTDHVQVADPRYLGVLAQSNPIGPDAVTVCVWAYPHPFHRRQSIMEPGYWQPCADLIRVGDVVMVQSNYGKSEQHTFSLVRLKGAPGVVVMTDSDWLGRRRAA